MRPYVMALEREEAFLGAPGAATFRGHSEERHVAPLAVFRGAAPACARAVLAQMFRFGRHIAVIGGQRSQIGAIRAVRRPVRGSQRCPVRFGVRHGQGRTERYSAVEGRGSVQGQRARGRPTTVTYP
jgi:hypothetical protein